MQPPFPQTTMGSASLPVNRREITRSVYLQTGRPGRHQGLHRMRTNHRARSAGLGQTDAELFERKGQRRLCSVRSATPQQQNRDGPPCQTDVAAQPESRIAGSEGYSWSHLLHVDRPLV